jgi:hypothetical protein
MDCVKTFFADTAFTYDTWSLMISAVLEMGGE